MRFSVKPIVVNVSALGEIRWYEYAVRFLFGGLITAAAGIIAKKYGPSVGGIFLAFPAIFPTGATLVEKHEREHKAEKGLHGERRARQAVAADAVGATMGAMGLALFAVAIWRGLPRLESVVMILLATLNWATLSGLIWISWKRNWIPRRRSRNSRAQQKSS